MKVFYSWKSDLPSSINRSFIQVALEKAAERVRKDESVQVEPVIERDTQGLPGSPDIKAAILDKIDACDAFVCDVSLVNSDTSEKPTPNPNVLFELGYAAKKLGMDKIILVQNTVFGPPEKLPFDLRNHRVTAYSAVESDENKSKGRHGLSRDLEAALRAITGLLGLEEEQVRQPSIPPLSREALAVARLLVRGSQHGVAGDPTTTVKELAENANRAISHDIPDFSDGVSSRRP